MPTRFRSRVDDTVGPVVLGTGDVNVLLTVASDDNVVVNLPGAKYATRDLAVGHFPRGEDASTTYGGVEIHAKGTDVLFCNNGANPGVYEGDTLTYDRGTTVVLRPIRIAEGQFGWLVLWASRAWPQVTS